MEATDLSLFEMVGYRSRFSGRAPLVPGAWKNCETQVPFASQCLLGLKMEETAGVLSLCSAMQARHAGVKPLFTPSVLNGLKGRIFTEARKVSCLKIFAGSTMALTLAMFTTAAWGQMARQNTRFLVSTSASAEALNQDVALKISQAWAEGKDASGAVAFQENGEIAMSEGNPQQARHYFEAAEHELSNLKPSSGGSPSTSAY